MMMPCDIKDIPYFNLSSDIFMNIFWVIVRQRSACAFISSVTNVPVTTLLSIFHKRLFSDLVKLSAKEWRFISASVKNCNKLMFHVDIWWRKCAYVLCELRMNAKCH